MPSTVVIFLPTQSIASTEHPKTALPSRMHVHAPQVPALQTSLGPVIAGSRRSRRADSSVVRGCTVTCRLALLMFSDNVTLPESGLLISLPSGSAALAGVGNAVSATAAATA